MTALWVGPKPVWRENIVTSEHAASLLFSPIFQAGASFFTHLLRKQIACKTFPTSAIIYSDPGPSRLSPLTIHKPPELLSKSMVEGAGGKKSEENFSTSQSKCGCGRGGQRQKSQNIFRSIVFPKSKCIDSYLTCQTCKEAVFIGAQEEG